VELDPDVWSGWRNHPESVARSSSADPELKAAKLMRSPRERALINAFGAQRGWRCWSRTEPAVHYAFYELANVEEARELTDSDKIKPLIADLDRVWGNRVSRRREILEIVQEIVS
jgi:hypothetical protein